MNRYPFEVRLPLAPYRFQWSGSEPIECERVATEGYTEERYFHEDGTQVVIRSYQDGSLHILSDRAPILVEDRAQDWTSPQAMSVVSLP